MQAASNHEFIIISKELKYSARLHIQVYNYPKEVKIGRILFQKYYVTIILYNYEYNNT